MSRIKDISGLRSGKLVAVDIAEAGGSYKETLWNCKCDCGNVVVAKVSKITGKLKTHCGCIIKREDLTGNIFGLLKVVRFVEKKGTRNIWECECTCGNITNVCIADLKAGHTKSCGCYRDTLNISHGMTNTRPYKIWQNMIKRCTYDKDDTTFANYGGRGISFDGKWSTFEGFWSDMSEGYSDDLELDRADFNANYCKENCRWIDKSLQNYNKRISTLNTSGRTGVSFYTSRNQWEAYISFQKQFIKLGYFNTFEDAVKAREEAELKYYGYIKE